MAYGLKYLCEFDQLNQTAIRYRLEFLFKDYAGTVQRVKGAAAPVIHQYQDDSPKAALKGSNLQMRLINEGWLPLKSFYSDDDDGIMVNFYWGEQLMFTGFLLQDDCTEIKLDITHELSLNATDGIGLLKGVPFDAAPKGVRTSYRIYESADVVLGAPNTLIIANCNYRPVVGTVFQFLGVNYTPTAVADGSGFFNVTVAETVVTTPSQPGFISVLESFSLYVRNNILSFIYYCIKNTGLELDTNVYCNLYEIANKRDNSMLQQIFEDPQIFVGKNCYDALITLLSRFNCTMFQAFGKWQIIRWDELRYYTNNAVGYYRYNAQYAKLLGYEILDQNIATGIGLATILETGTLSKVYRPYQFAKEQFNYKILDLIVNDDLQIVGDLVSSVITGSNTVKTYQFPTTLPNGKNWIHNYGDTAKIVVVTSNITGLEVDRYILQPVVDNGNHSGGFASYPNFQLNDVEVSAGDVFDFSFRIKTIDEAVQGVSFRAAFFLAVSPTYNYQLAFDGTRLRWNKVISPTTDGLGMSVNVTGAVAADFYEYKVSTLYAAMFDNTQLKVPPFPEDGLLRIRIMGTNNNIYGPLPRPAVIKDITLSIDNYINESIRIIGQTHKTQQTRTVNSNQDIETVTDDSPRNTIAGTLFTTNFNNFLQRRTVLWQRATVPTESKSLGAIITGEIVQWRSRQRTIFDGQFRGLLNDGKHVSALSVFTNAQAPGENFVPGTLNIDYRNNVFFGTLWSIYETGESNGVADYNFEYLYKTQ